MHLIFSTLGVNTKHIDAIEFALHDIKQLSEIDSNTDEQKLRTGRKKVSVNRILLPALNLSLGLKRTASSA